MASKKRRTLCGKACGGAYDRLAVQRAPRRRRTAESRAVALAAGLPLLCRDDPCVRGFLAAAPCGWAYRTPGELAALATALPLGAEAAPLRRAARQAAAPYGREPFGAAVEALYRRLILQRNAAPLAAPERRVILW